MRSLHICQRRLRGCSRFPPSLEGPGWCFHSRGGEFHRGAAVNVITVFMQLPWGRSLPLVPGLHGAPAGASSSQGRSLLKSSLGTSPLLLQASTTQSFRYLLLPCPPSLLQPQHTLMGERPRSPGQICTAQPWQNKDLPFWPFTTCFPCQQPNEKHLKAQTFFQDSGCSQKCVWLVHP